MYKYKKLIYFILKNFKPSRDCDNTLIWIVWKKQCPQNLDTIENFQEAFCNNKLPNIKSIERMRRQIQEEYPETRGEKYLERQNKLQKKALDELGY